MKQSSVDISVIIVTYNRDEALCETLRCLLTQDPPPREIIVVDQSADHSAETRLFLHQLVAASSIKYILQAEPNAQRARNRAIAEAVGQVLLFVDDDIKCDRDLVGAHWKNYVDSELAAVCGFYTEPGESPVDNLPRDCDDPLTGWIYFPHCYTKRIECHLLPTCNGSVRRNVAIQLGGFDENFTHTLLDDTDFACRLLKSGLKSVHDPEARLVHHKEQRGGKRPSGINDFVIADSNRWYIWFYFFGVNFGWSGRTEIARRIRACVLRKKTIIRPWYLALACYQLLGGATRAAVALRKGRRLGFQAAASPLSLANVVAAGSASLS